LFYRPLVREALSMRKRKERAVSAVLFKNLPKKYIFNNLKINILHYYCYIYIQVFGIADLTGISRKKSPPHLVSLIKVEGLFSQYIVTHFDIVHSESLVLR